MMQLSQVSNAVGGQIHGADLMLEGISINTRADCQNRLFIALKGDNFDAHDFVDQAAEAGASAVMLERDVATDLPSVKVASTHKALTSLAAWWRSQFVIPVIGVTGSVGKTSVKEMLGAVFSQLGVGVVTQGNLNNEIGVPLTLMRLNRDDRYAIVEMGMNHAGEISRITAAVRPTIALINNAAAAHLEGLGSVDAVAQAKGEIYEGLSADGVAVINHDDAFADQWRSMVGARRIISFGLDAKADISATYQTNEDKLCIFVSALGEQFEVELSTIGEHNVRNALAAIAVSTAANIPCDKIKAGLQNYRPIFGRLNLSRFGELTLIDDSYNANPASMRAAIEVLTGYPDSCLIVGDMAELGAAAGQEHRQLGQVAARLGVQRLLAYGNYAKTVVEGFVAEAKGADARALAFTTQEDLIAHAKQTLECGTILIKGSRSAKMERVVTALMDKFHPAQKGEG